MQKVLLINGSPHEHGCTYTALNEVAQTLTSFNVPFEFLYLGQAPIRGCIACGKCASGRCVFEDSVNRVLDNLDQYSALILGSPVYYSGPSGQLCAFLDRLFYASRGRMANKLGAAVLSCRRGGASASFDRLNKYFSISNMHIVGSQYWNQVHGNTPEEVMQDVEGLQTMRTLAVNLAWLLKCIDAADQMGVPRPQYEPKTATNFIR